MIHIYGGGTLSHIRSHFALCAPAYGSTAKKLHEILLNRHAPSTLHLTKMAGGTTMETNVQVYNHILHVLDKDPKAILFINVAMCDFEGKIGTIPSGKYAERLESRNEPPQLILTPAIKVLSQIKQQFPQCTLIGSKTTTHASQSTQIEKSYRQIEEAKVDLVLANDTGTRVSILVSKEHTQVCPSREQALEDLATQLQYFEEHK